MLFLAATLAPAGLPQAVAAFPGAQGGGALSVGGRGGVVLYVSNLNDSGLGSLRACVEASGARNCIFRIGGTITLATTLNVTNPYLTIAGQTAPGGGIQITNNSSITGDLVRVSTHDVIIRYIRARNASPYNTSGQFSIPIAINSAPVDVYNVIFDHISMAYGLWDNGGVWATTNKAYNITFQWCIQGEPTFRVNHSVNDNISGSTPAMSDQMTDIDFHHNFLTGANHRSPTHRVKSGRMINNLVYNGSYYDIKAGGIKDVIGNYLKRGPYTNSTIPLHEIQTWNAVSIGTTASPSLYIFGNAADSNGFDPSADQWTGGLTGLAPGEDNSDTVTSPISATYKRVAPLTAVGVAINVDSATDLANSSGILLPTYPNLYGNPGVGASIKLNDTACDGSWVSNRDLLDDRYVSEFINNKGHSSDVMDPGVLPSLAPGTQCTETVPDGIPDVWKTLHGLSISDSTLHAKLASNGYTYLEQYLNGVSTTSAPLPPTMLKAFVQ